MRRGGDDAERALAADEQVAQVVAGVVLAQAGQAVPDLALRRSRPRARGTARARCRSAAPACRRRWWRGCRRWCSCPRPPGSAGTAGRRCRGLLQRSAARSRPRPSWSGWPRRCRAPRFMRAQAQHHLACRCRRAPSRRPGRCCRPAARCDVPCAAQARTTAATSAVEPGRTTASALPRAALAPVDCSQARRGRRRRARGRRRRRARRCVQQASCSWLLACCRRGAAARQRTCSAQAANSSQAQQPPRASASQRAGAAVAAGAHHAFGEVEPDQQADPAVGVHAVAQQAGQRQAAAAAP